MSASLGRGRRLPFRKFSLKLTGRSCFAASGSLCGPLAAFWAGGGFPHRPLAWILGGLWAVLRGLPVLPSGGGIPATVLHTEQISVGACAGKP